MRGDGPMKINSTTPADVVEAPSTGRSRLAAKDLQIEYPSPDNTQGEHMRCLCDVTHLPSGIRARGRGRGRTSELAKIAAMAQLKLNLED